jgi:hypothetical protein
MQDSGLEAPFSMNDLARIESLGDNCELGFVLRRLGWEDGSLLRWASISPESLLATLRGDFEHIYEYENLTPLRLTMVQDARYGTAWHTEMTASVSGGALVFNHDETIRRGIHAKEQDKRAHLVAKLRKKFAHPNPLFVIKARTGLNPEVLEGIHYQLYRRVRSPRFTLLEICADEARSGQMTVVDRNHLRGWVRRFASYEKANDGDDASWHSVLRQALTIHSENVSITQDEGPFTLPFPHRQAPDLHHRVEGDVRLGMARLISGNEWCRLIEDDRFRLHARGFGSGATVISWMGLHLPPGALIQVRGSCAIPESKPVKTTLQVGCGETVMHEATLVLSDLNTQTMTLPLPTDERHSCFARLSVEPVEALHGSERAVIDVSPVKIFLPTS